MVGRIDGSFGDATRDAVAWFQTGFAWQGKWLEIDGWAGPKTQQALQLCLDQGGRCSRHFRFVEFASKGNGHIHVRRELVAGLERIRDVTGRPVEIVSGYRDAVHNRRVGGAPNSQHLYGNAADLNYPLARQEVINLRVFSGIGWKTRGRAKMVRHVDVRHMGPNPTRGSVSNPTLWEYP